MISAVNNQPSFCGIVPVRVFINGEQKSDPKLIKSATRQLTSALIQPKKYTEIANIFSQFDPQYYQNGYVAKTKPSDIFKLIIDRYRGAFLATGEQTRIINNYGKKVGKEKILCRERNINESLDLIVAKRNYADIIHSMLNSPALRLREFSKQRNPVTLNINITGKKLDSISFDT